MRTPRIINPRDIEENPQKAIKELNEAYLELHREVGKMKELIDSHEEFINGR